GAGRRGVDADLHVAQAGGDGGRGVLDVQLVAGAADQRAVQVAGADAEELGQPGRRAGVGDAVDVVEGEPGVGQRLVDHGRLQGPAGGVQLAGGRDRVRDADEGGGAAQGPRAHEAAPARSWATAS